MGEISPVAPQQATTLAPNQKPLLLNAVYDGFFVGLLFPYISGLNIVCKKYHGFYTPKPNKWEHYWRFSIYSLRESPKEFFVELARLAGRSGSGYRTDQSTFFEMIRHAVLNPTKGAFSSESRSVIYPLGESDCAITSDGFYPDFIDVYRSMGGRFLRTAKSWQVESSPAMLIYNLVNEVGVSEDQFTVMPGKFTLFENANFRPVLNIVPSGLLGECAPLPAGERQEGEDTVCLAVIPPIKKTSYLGVDIGSEIEFPILHSYQHEGVKFLVERTSALLGDDMGIGKTYQAIVAAIYLKRISPPEHKILIVCQVSLIFNWEKEIRVIQPDAKIATQEWCEDADWIITNFERQGADGVPNAKSCCVFIIDEAHLVKGVTSTRTKMAFEIASQVPHRYLLTGSPIPNSEVDIHTLLRISGHPIGDIPVKEFSRQFTDDPEFKKNFNELIKSDWMKRRKKEEVLKNLKGKQRQLLYVEFDEPERLRFNKIVLNNKLTGNKKFSLIRRLTESAKIPFVVDLIAEIDKKEKVVIFFSFLEQVTEMRKLLQSLGHSPVEFTGNEKKLSARAAAEKAFREDPNTRFFLATYQSGGVGLNLQSAQYVFFCGMPWSPALLAQAEDRVYRNGQQNMVIVKFLFIEGTHDAKHWEIIGKKEQITSGVIDPEEEKRAIAAMIKDYKPVPIEAKKRKGRPPTKKKRVIKDIVIEERT